MTPWPVEELPPVGPPRAVRRLGPRLPGCRCKPACGTVGRVGRGRVPGVA